MQLVSCAMLSSLRSPVRGRKVDISGDNQGCKDRAEGETISRLPAEGLASSSTSDATINLQISPGGPGTKFRIADSPFTRAVHRLYLPH